MCIEEKRHWCSQPNLQLNLLPWDGPPPQPHRIPLRAPMLEITKEEIRVSICPINTLSLTHGC